MSDPQLLHSSRDIALLLAPLFAFCISFCTSMAGVSGAFLLLPFQVSILGFTSPAVSATNFLFNVIGCPGGIIRFIREQRMVWPLALWISGGTLPGIFVGYYLRVRFLPDPRIFKYFVGTVLLYIGLLLLHNCLKMKKTAPGAPGNFVINSLSSNSRAIHYHFQDKPVVINTLPLALFSLGVGIIGGVYGVGGGALMAPFCVTVLKIPVYTLAASTLFSTFIASIFGVLFYSLIPLAGGQTAPPDWILGICLGAGGLAGMYCGAQFQKKISEKWIKLLLSGIILSVAGKYLFPLFF